MLSLTPKFLKIYYGRRILVGLSQGTGSQVVRTHPEGDDGPVNLSGPLMLHFSIGVVTSV